MLEVMLNFSLVKLQVWVVMLLECEQTQQSVLPKHFLNPIRAILLSCLWEGGGNLLLTKISLRDLVRE